MDRESREHGRKKVYEPPVLVTYGTVWKLTQKVGRNGQFDRPKPVGLRQRTHA